MEVLVPKEDILPTLKERVIEDFIKAAPDIAKNYIIKDIIWEKQGLKICLKKI